jgi:DNA polymerase-3 subunit delta
MGQQAPTVYLLHGDDEHAIAREISALQAKLGDKATAEMNSSFLDGRTSSLNELEAVASTIPFLATRRLIVLTNPLVKLDKKAHREKFLRILENLPEKTALIVQLSKPLRTDHWLYQWGQNAGKRAYIRSYHLPKGVDMAQWIQNEALQHGGNFSPQAAGLLATIVGTNTRHAAQEIEKMLAYVAYNRPVDVEDVQHLAVSIEHEDVSQIFKMVDALGNQAGQAALDQLHRLLSQREPLSLFGMIIRQFRLLLLAIDVVNIGGGLQEVQSQLGLHPYVAQKILSQAKNFSTMELEEIYHHLLDLDVKIKTGQMPVEVALDTLVAALTQPAAPSSH